MEDRLGDMQAVLDAIGSQRVALLGSSEGACACIMFAATYPERTSAMILFSPFVVGMADEECPWAWTAEFWDLLRTAMENSWGTPDGSGVEFCTPSLIGDETAREWYAHPAAQIPRATLVELPGTDHYPWEQNADEVVGQIEEFLTGVRRERDDDRVLATVLFTDIVESTEHTSEVGDRRWRELLDAHDEMVRRQLERFSGKEVKSTGDGFLATFDGPARGIRCALAVSDGARRLGIGVRAGLHTGELERRGDDVGGIAVHIGSRVAAQARADEVLVSSTVKDLVAGSRIEFADRGEHALKGVPGTWRLFAALADD
jgi:class 3 adenylate cyclase